MSNTTVDNVSYNKGFSALGMYTFASKVKLDKGQQVARLVGTILGTSAVGLLVKKYASDELTSLRDWLSVIGLGILSSVSYFFGFKKLSVVQETSGHLDQSTHPCQIAKAILDNLKEKMNQGKEGDRIPFFYLGTSNDMETFSLYDNKFISLLKRNKLNRCTPIRSESDYVWTDPNVPNNFCMTIKEGEKSVKYGIMIGSWPINLTISSIQSCPVYLCSISPDNKRLKLWQVAENLRMFLDDKLELRGEEVVELVQDVELPPELEEKVA